MGKADPKRSEGARLERAAFRAYLRRRARQVDGMSIVPNAAEALAEALTWVLTRQQRYDKKAGGLGK